MQFYSYKYMCLALLMLATGNAIQAYQEFGNESCCVSNQYECSCEPLYCGAWGIQIDGGVRPVIWRGRSDFFSVENAGGLTAVAPFADLPKFSSLYHTPWTIGGQLSYAFGTNYNVFAEVHYAQAKPKNTAVGLVVADDLYLNLSRYKVIDAYIGARYYTNRWCNKVAFFIGGQIGLVHHRAIDFNSSLTGIGCCSFLPEPFFRGNTSFAGGLNYGLDICYCGNWSFVITGEIIASRGPRTVGTLVLSGSDAANLDGATNLLLASRVKTEIAFPVTFGIKYNF